MNSSIRHASRAIAFALTLAIPAATWADDGPSFAHKHGKSLAEWSATWWQWALSLPVERSPFFDDGGNCTNGANGQRGPVWFLAGVINASGTAVRDCVIPAGKAMFFPIINVECSTLEAPPFHGDDRKQLRACATGFRIADVTAKIDGVPVPNLQRQLATSPLFWFRAPPNNILGVEPGIGKSVSNGYYLMLPPMSVGRHVLEFGGSFPDFPFTLNISYYLTIAPHPQ